MHNGRAALESFIGRSVLTKALRKVLPMIEASL